VVSTLPPDANDNQALSETVLRHTQIERKNALELGVQMERMSLLGRAES